jgi:hypothetical protein
MSMRRFGKWLYSERTHMLAHGDYAIDLNLYRSRSAILGILLHVAEKQMFSSADVGDFLRAVREIKGIYA